jgi:hypothetical protein
MPAQELAVFGTIAAGVAAWAVAEARGSRTWWTLAALLTLIHSIVAFFVFYDGSHARAQAETMKQTAALTGVNFSGGIYVNYGFLATWLGDAAWWTVSPISYHSRPAWLSHLIHGFIFFIIVNGAVIFADGWAQVLGVTAVGVAIIGMWRRDAPAGRMPRALSDHVSGGPAK